MKSSKVFDLAIHTVSTINIYGILIITNEPHLQLSDANSATMPKETSWPSSGLEHKQQ